MGLDEMPLSMENVMDDKQQQLACVGRESSSTLMQAQLPLPSPPPRIVLFRNSLAHPVILVPAIVATMLTLLPDEHCRRSLSSCRSNLAVGAGQEGAKSRSSFPQTHLIACTSPFVPSHNDAKQILTLRACPLLASERFTVISSLLFTSSAMQLAFPW